MFDRDEAFRPKTTPLKAGDLVRIVDPSALIRKDTEYVLSVSRIKFVNDEHRTFMYDGFAEVKQYTPAIVIETQTSGGEYYGGYHRSNIVVLANNDYLIINGAFILP